MYFQKLESTVVAVVGDATDCSESSNTPKARSPLSDSSSNPEDWMLAVHDILANDVSGPCLCFQKRAETEFHKPWANL